MSLSDTQWDFAKALGRLYAWLDEQPGMKYTLGCCRCGLKKGSAPAKTCGGHSELSHHAIGLAQDINLFLWSDEAGRYIYQTSTEAHTPVGEEWERLGGTWGGRWPGRRADGNHYSWNESR